MFCCTSLYVHSSIAIILMGKRELIALLNLSSWCLVMVERLFLAVPRGSLQFVIVVFPDHNHLLFLILITCVPVPVISGIYYCPEFQLLSREVLASHLSQSTFHLRSLYFQHMPLDISTTISLSTCHKRSALGWPIGTKMKISKRCKIYKI